MNSMIIKEAKYKKVKRLTRILVSEEVHGCDNCKKKIKPRESHLEVTIFYNRDHDDSKTNKHQFCSWRCVLKYLPKISCDYFVDLPFLHYDRKGVGSYEELLSIIKKISQ